MINSPGPCPIESSSHTPLYSKESYEPIDSLFNKPKPFLIFLSETPPEYFDPSLYSNLFIYSPIISSQFGIWNSLILNLNNKFSNVSFITFYSRIYNKSKFPNY
jgi:hypothetical protein